MSSTRRGSDYRKNAAYYTPDALAEALVGLLPIIPGTRVMEPSCGGGAFVRAMLKRGAFVDGCDIDPDAPGLGLCWRSVVKDFLLVAVTSEPIYDWIVGNPPYSAPSALARPDGSPILEECASAHIKHALQLTKRHVAMLLRLGFMETPVRAAWLATTPLRRVTVLGQRPSFTGGGTDSAAYGWFWWDLEHRGSPELGFLPRWRRWPL